MIQNQLKYAQNIKKRQKIDKSFLLICVARSGTQSKQHMILFEILYPTFVGGEGLSHPTKPRHPTPISESEIQDNSKN